MITLYFTSATLNAFTSEMAALRETALLSLSEQDYHHLKKIIWVNRFFLFIGFSTAWLFPNPFSMIFIGLAFSGMWTIVAHHVLHGGYDRLLTIPKRYHSQYFAAGLRRYIDWPDWIYPPAWKYEHNKLHHFFVNEVLDPDQLSYRLMAKTSAFSASESPWRKRLRMAIKISFWKCSYYAFNTIKAFNEKTSYEQTSDFKSYRKQTYRHCVFPYLAYHFVGIPLMFSPFGWKAVLFVVVNRLGAELITNWHTFFIIVTNHTGPDLGLQKQHFSNKSTFYIAQITSSCNASTGGFWRDYWHGYLNYQIEHHLFPTLPVSHYARLQPKVKALCEKYGVPYVQEPLRQRIKKLFTILLQHEQMPHARVTMTDVITTAVFSPTPSEEDVV